MMLQAEQKLAVILCMVSLALVDFELVTLLSRQMFFGTLMPFILAMVAVRDGHQHNETEQLRKCCRSLKKQPYCRYSSHVDGEYYWNPSCANNLQTKNMKKRYTPDDSSNNSDNSNEQQVQASSSSLSKAVQRHDAESERRAYQRQHENIYRSFGSEPGDRLIPDGFFVPCPRADKSIMPARSILKKSELITLSEDDIEVVGGSNGWQWKLRSE